MAEITILTAQTTVRMLHPLATEDEASFRRRMEAMVDALQRCEPETIAVVIVHPNGRPACVVTQVRPQESL